ncbi:MAG: PAS domain-containing protein [Nannocystaceae bacterium]
METNESRLSADVAREIVRCVPALVLVLSRDGAVEYVNPRFSAASGYALAELRGRDAAASLCAPGYEEHLRGLFADFLAGRRRHEDVCPLRTRGGEVREIEWSACASVGDSEVTRSLILFGEDVSDARRERLRAERAAAERVEEQRRSTRALMQSFIDAFPGFVTLLSPEGRVALANEHTRMFGERDADDDRPAWERVIPGVAAEDLIRFACAVQRIAEGGPREVLELVIKGHVLESTVTPICGDDGELVYIAAYAVDVPDRSAAMHEVTRSEEALRESTRLAKLGTWDYDLVTGEVRWSEEILRLFELDQFDHRASYDAFLAHVHPSDRERVDRAFRRSLVERTPYAIDHRLRVPSGAVRHVRERGRTIYADDGTPLRSIGTVQDITAEVESMARLRRILDNMFAFVAIFDHSGRIVEVNRAPLELFGARREELIGVALWDTPWWSFSAASRARLRDVHGRAGRGEVIRGDFVVRVRDRDYITIDAMFGPLRGESGEIEGVIASAVDISERKRVESEAHRASELLRAVVGGAPLILFAIELDGTISLSEGPALAHIGLRDSEAVGRSVFALYGALPPFTEGLRRAFSGEEARFSGSYGDVVFDVFLAPRRDHRGAVDGAVGVAVDVTQRHAQETRIAAQLAEKEVLLREIHHRVKNNLQVVSSLLHFQAKRARSPEDAAAFVEGRERVFAMILVHEKLYESADLSRVEMDEYVRALAAALVASQPARHRVEVRIDAAPVGLAIEHALPSGMILAELLTNAFKYAFPGGRGGRIDVRIGCEGGRVRLEVEDDGCGVADPSGLLTSGGFGLRLVRTLTLQLDGELEITGALGAGVRVRVAFEAEAEACA